MKWTQEHDEALREADDGSSDKEVARKMSRKFNLPFTKNMIIGRRRRLEKGLKPEATNQRHYSIEEIERLRALKREGQTSIAVAEALGRSRWSVEKKWQELRQVGRALHD